MSRNDKGLYICPNQHMYNANKYGDTCPNCGAKQKDKLKSPEEYEEELALTPSQWICGLLVCIKGVNKGRSYPIKHGKNFLGSNPNMDIYIKGDLEILPEKHTVFSYDDITLKTLILGNVSSGLIYLNKNCVYDVVELNDMDRIEIGSSRFVFSTFCSAQFNWDDL